ncbi:MAG: hypothetical protein PHY14_04695 [Candidatus Gracilibacteria bacterium]|nr:hypothetical protein [Candidatus Gracilibacteria bacterium]
MKESIVLSAWELITKFHSLKKLNFLPSLIGMLWLFLILVYQAVFTYVIVFHKKDQFFEALIQFVHNDYFTEVVVTIAVVFVLYMFLAPLTEGGIVEMIHSYRKSDGKKFHRTFQGIFDGFQHFLPLFEAHNVVTIFRPLAIITFYIFLLRIFGKEYFTPISWVMLIYLIFSFFLNMCFSYTKYFIIFEGKGTIAALSASTGMAVRNIGITLQLYYTMILLYLRTIFVGIFFLVFPFIASAIIAFFTIMSLKLIFLSIFGIISLIFFIVIVHLNSTLEIFIEATWYEAYMLCKKEDEENGHGHHDSHGGHDEHASHYSHDTPHDNHGHH